MELEKERTCVVTIMKHTSYFLTLLDSATDAREEGKVAFIQGYHSNMVCIS